MSRLPLALQIAIPIAGVILLCSLGIVVITWMRPAPVTVPRAVPTPVPAVRAADQPTQSIANSTPLPTVKPFATATFQPTEAPLPSTYEWVSIERVSTPNRARFRAAIVMPADYSDDQLTRAFRDAVNRAFREQPTAKAVVVFGHSSRAEISKGADLGSAWASTDRQGWAGDGKFDNDADQGKIVVSIGSAWTPRPQSRRAVDR